MGDRSHSLISLDVNGKAERVKLQNPGGEGLLGETGF
jgi:hypothetical protein